MPILEAKASLNPFQKSPLENKGGAILAAVWIAVTVGQIGESKADIMPNFFTYSATAGARLDNEASYGGGFAAWRC